MRNAIHSTAIAAAIGLWLCAPAQAVEETVDPPGRVARLSYLQGDVSLLPAGSDDNDWTTATVNRPLTSGDKLALDRAARVELQLGSADVHLNGDANFAFVELSDAVMQASLTAGALHISVRELIEGEVVEIDTPHAAVALKQPGEYHIALMDDGATTLVKTYSGASEVTDSRGTTQVQAQEQVLIAEGNSAVAALGPRDDFDTWAHERSRRPEQSAASRYVAPNVIGYEDLDGHGEWSRDPVYGNVWYPSHVAVDWSPYSYGHWTWVGPWGWTWVDSAPWGFAPFHYGRWAFVRSRWCWVPGPIHVRPVYAPALVAWVGAAPGFSVSVSFGSGIGWFPLAPYEVYVPGYHYSHHHLYSVNYSNTIFVNNVYINRVYTNRNSYVVHANRHARNVVTVVNRDSFVRGRPVREHIVRADERGWRVTNTPPQIAPHRDSRHGPDHGARPHTPQRWDDRQVVARNRPQPHARSDRDSQGPRTNPVGATASTRGPAISPNTSRDLRRVAPNVGQSSRRSGRSTLPPSDDAPRGGVARADVRRGDVVHERGNGTPVRTREQPSATPRLAERGAPQSSHDFRGDSRQRPFDGPKRDRSPAPTIERRAEVPAQRSGIFDRAERSQPTYGAPRREIPTRSEQPFQQGGNVLRSDAPRAWQPDRQAHQSYPTAGQSPGQIARQSAGPSYSPGRSAGPSSAPASGPSSAPSSGQSRGYSPGRTSDSSPGNSSGRSHGGRER